MWAFRQEKTIKYLVLVAAVVAALVLPHSAGASSSTIPSGVLEPNGSLFSAEAAAGLQLAVINVYWDRAETSNGFWNESYFASVRNEMATARTAGLSLILDPGVQNPPLWAFGVDPGAAFVDQYGENYNQYIVTTPTYPGMNVLNGVWSAPVRKLIAQYLAKVFSELGTAWYAVRWGGGLRYNEATYPGSTTHTNCYWAYDVNAQNPKNALGNGVPAGVRGWKPGTGTVTQAQTFLTWYLKSLRDYISWGLGTIRHSFNGEVWVLLGSYGMRPGDTTTAANNLLDGQYDRASEVAYGLDWAGQLPAWSAYGTITADVTWGDRTDFYYYPSAYWGPMHYVSSILPTSMKLAGENAGSPYVTTTDLNNLVTNLRAYGGSRALWMNEAATQVTGNASLTDIGAAMQGSAAARH